MVRINHNHNIVLMYQIPSNELINLFNAGQYPGLKVSKVPLNFLLEWCAGKKSPWNQAACKVFMKEIKKVQEEVVRTICNFEPAHRQYIEDMFFDQFKRLWGDCEGSQSSTYLKGHHRRDKQDLRKA